MHHSEKLFTINVCRSGYWSLKKLLKQMFVLDTWDDNTFYVYVLYAAVCSKYKSATLHSQCAQGCYYSIMRKQLCGSMLKNSRKTIVLPTSICLYILFKPNKPLDLACINSLLLRSVPVVKYNHSLLQSITKCKHSSWESSALFK